MGINLLVFFAKVLLVYKTRAIQLLKHTRTPHTIYNNYHIAIDNSGNNCTNQNTSVFVYEFPLNFKQKRTNYPIILYLLWMQ